MTMFRCEEHMTQEQQTIAQEFQDSIETESALCVSEIRKINQAIANNTSSESSSWNDKKCANLSFHSLQKYWQHRLDCMIDFVVEKDYKLSEELAKKYLNGIKIRMTL